MNPELDNENRLKTMENILKQVPYLPVSYTHKSTIDRAVFLNFMRFLAECDDIGKMEIYLRVFSRFKFKVEDRGDNQGISNLLIIVIKRLLSNSVNIPSKVCCYNLTISP